MDSRSRPTSRDWLSLTEAAEELGVTDRTLRRKIASGDLPAYRMGPRLVRVKRADLEALLTRIPAGGAA